MAGTSPGAQSGRAPTAVETVVEYTRMAPEFDQTKPAGHKVQSASAAPPSLTALREQRLEEAAERLRRLARLGAPRVAAVATAPVEAAALSRGAAAEARAGAAPPLPWAGQWCCVRCGATVAGIASLASDMRAVRLELTCPTCGSYAEVLSRPRDGVVLGASARAMEPLLIECQCPECAATLHGRAFVRRGVVWVEMSCPRHGYFRDRVETDPHLFAELLAAPPPAPPPDGPALSVVTIDPQDDRGVAGSGVAAAVEHARASGERVCLTTTINRAVNRDQIGPLFEFAVANVDAIAALVFQPVMFAERISLQQLADQRYTLGELARAIAARSGADVGRDFLPLASLAAIPAVLGLARQHATIARASAGRWSLGAYFVVGAGGRPTPLGRFFHLRRLLDVAHETAGRVARRGGARAMTVWDRIRLGFQIAGCVRRAARETRWLPLRLLRSWRALREEPNRPASASDLRLLLVAGVQSPDRYRFALPQ